jgi:hypothetical protein
VAPIKLAASSEWALHYLHQNFKMTVVQEEGPLIAVLRILGKSSQCSICGWD